MAVAKYLSMDASVACLSEFNGILAPKEEQKMAQKAFFSFFFFSFGHSQLVFTRAPLNTAMHSGSPKGGDTWRMFCHAPIGASSCLN